MKWNRVTLLKAVKELAETFELAPYEGKSVDDLIAYLESARADGMTIKGLSTNDAVLTSDIREAYTKAVEISYDSSTDDVNVTDMATASEDGEGEDADLKVTDTDSEETKQYKKLRNELREAGFGKPQMLKSLHEWGTKQYLPAGSYDRMASRKRYDRKAANGETVFASADAAELFAAAARFSSMGVNDYEHKSSDREIWQKAGATYDATLGGVLVPDVYSADMIELMPQYGTARKYAGVYTMSGPREFVSRFGADATTYKLAENGAAPESTPTFNGVWLNAEEIGTLSKMPLRLLQHSAIDAADAIARSQARSRAKFEDQSFWNGENGFEGIQSKVGTNSTHVVSGASAYTDVSVTDAQTWISKLPDWTDEFEDQIGIYCHRSFDDQVFQRFGPAAGGAATVDMTTGRITHFKGIEIFHVNVMNNARTFTSGNVMAYVGPLQACTKFGEVSGTMSVRQTDQRWFEYRQWAALSSVEVAINPHDVLDDAESGLWALQIDS